MDKKTQKILEKASGHDFDGHTEFLKMTPDQRLTWLDEANSAFLEMFALANPELRVAEQSPKYGTDQQ